MRKKRKRALRLSSAWTLIGLGVLGCTFPVIPGIPMLVAGIYLLSPKKFNKWLHKFKSRLSPRNQHRIHKFLEKFKRK